MLARIVAYRGPDAPPLDERLGGLPLVTRAALVAQAKGARRIVVELGDADRVAAQVALEDPRIRVPLELVRGDASEAAWTLAYDEILGVRLRDAASRKEAKRRLFEACRKPVDGVISRHLNRHVSIAISKALVETRVSPNAMTVATFSLSLVAAAFAVQGGYLPTLAAAFLMQWNSILDGCDGELARVRHQGSKLGQWLDTIGDDWSNVIFWASLGYGARTVPDIGGTLALCGYVGAAGNGLAALANYAVLARLGSGDFYALDAGKTPDRSGFVGRTIGIIELVLKQDFFLFLMLVIAALGVMHQALVAIAVGAVVTCVNSTVRAVGFFSRPRS
ncbi:MAG: CDP-alcohol phosphatidyltransferase family protein [Deltaproteobacteria bacterium]|nr:CDP-alcohol phosphatidyltransferase family protein [Deltaproteobacteria bacterium]